MNMHLEIKGVGYPLTAALLTHTERQLRFAFDPTSGRVERVVVSLGGLKGPHGGREKFCRIQVHLQDGSPFVIEEAGADLYVVISQAVARTGRNVNKRLDRKRRQTRPGTPKMPGVEGYEMHDWTSHSIRPLSSIVVRPAHRSRD
jgi:ribosome-associated translation inhibitor RaiA